MFFSACASSLGKFPATHVYIPDVTNQVCTKYKITDSEKLKFVWESESPLQPKGDCDRMVGFHRDQFNPVKNWVRDAIEEFKKKLAYALEVIQSIQPKEI
jgi:hypothetical protein